jgi:hypothetical protein
LWKICANSSTSFGNEAKINLKAVPDLMLLAFALPDFLAGLFLLKSLLQAAA